MSKSKKRVLIVGTGTIGQPLIHLSAIKRDELGIDEVLFHKNTPLPEEAPKVKELMEIGAGLAVDKEKIPKFKT